MSVYIQRVRGQLFELHNNKLFEFIVISIIIFSALVTGVKTYEINSSLNQTVQWLDALITLFFLFEVAIRLIAEPRTLDCFKKGWNVFDFVIVVASLLPIDGNETVLLARLLRIFRVLRLISVIPELRVLVNSLLKALPRMGYIALLMFIIFYIYAAVGSSIFNTINPDLWGNISVALLTLFRISTFEDWTDVMYETMDVYPLSWIFYLTFIFLTAFVFLNMMIGVVLDVMQQEQKLYERERDDSEADEVHYIKAEMDQLSLKLDTIEALLRQERRGN